MPPDEKPQPISKWSSHVDSIWYDGGDLFVTYSTGKTVRYQGVPEAVFREVNSAASVGKALRELVRGKYAFGYVE